MLHSPGELRVYDSQGRVTGVVNNEVKEEIPGSQYFNSTVVLLRAGYYYYEVVGTDNGVYGLDVVYVNVTKGNIFNFTATSIPMSPDVTHRYTVDEAILSEGGNCTIVMVDSNCDNVFESALATGSTINSTQFLAGKHHATDFNGDGKVDILDLSAVAKAFNSRLGDSSWNPAVDFNGDRRINIVDINRVARDYGKAV